MRKKKGVGGRRRRGVRGRGRDRETRKRVRDGERVIEKGREGEKGRKKKENKE